MHSAHFHRAGVGREGLILGILVLVLFFAMNNIGAVYYQMRGVSPGHYPGSLAGYFCGITLAVLAMNLVERIASARWSAALSGRAAVLLALTFPTVFSLVVPFVSLYSHAGSLLFNSLQPMLWAMSLPVVLHLFFRNVPQPSQGMYYRVTVGAGHLCWALLVPLVTLLLGPSPMVTGARAL